MSVYYNEIDPDAAAWLQALMDADAIPHGEIDTRSIEDVTPNDVRGFTQCHFFAGIGGWAYALDLAGWPRSRPVWTGSCPCQPFSAAGKGAGFADERHLWPAWQHLIAQCAPPVVFGEQVASKHADAWIDLVHADMEGLGYAFGCIPFPAAGIGAPHIRDRNYWCGVGLADADYARLEGWKLPAERAAQCAAGKGSLANRMEHSYLPGEYQRTPGWQQPLRDRNGAVGFWRGSDWIECSDGKRRPIEPGAQPLAHGVSRRMGKLRGYGNAIVPQAAAAFVSAYMASREQQMQEAA